MKSACSDPHFAEYCPDCYQSRPEHERLIEQWLELTPLVAWVVGSQGRGKTRLLEWVLRDRHPVVVHCGLLGRFRREGDFYSHVLGQLGQRSITGDSLFDLRELARRDGALLLVVRDFHFLHPGLRRELMASFKGLRESREINIQIVGETRGHPGAGSASHVTSVRSLDEAEVERWGEHYRVAWRPDEARNVHRQTGGIPALVALYLEHRHMNTARPQLMDAWTRYVHDVKEQLRDRNQYELVERFKADRSTPGDVSELDALGVVDARTGRWACELYEMYL